MDADNSPSASTPMVNQRQVSPVTLNEEAPAERLSPLQNSELKLSNESAIFQDSLKGTSINTMVSNPMEETVMAEGYQGDVELSTYEPTPYPVASRTRSHDNMLPPVQLMERIMCHINSNLSMEIERQRAERTLENTHLSDNSEEDDKAEKEKVPSRSFVLNDVGPEFFAQLLRNASPF